MRYHYGEGVKGQKKATTHIGNEGARTISRPPCARPAGSFDDRGAEYGASEGPSLALFRFRLGAGVVRELLFFQLSKH